ncbi:putative bifunctional diguanylate cyclase/phosphodiesterase [Paludibacterium paludis]|uniref:GGDEF-domain containing protein n=1 Tax=Paludibacterium paludis TaxID=1225769 RepID=A0A918P0I1_9NEIS|nr:bifunctional diguanylate cyclase/phosphodiesterase [Paludibacterium paludis]GGY11930.1 GGDEF-domain containing protein [Paludibacterium paludis]
MSAAVVIIAVLLTLAGAVWLWRRVARRRDVLSVLPGRSELYGRFSAAGQDGFCVALLNIDGFRRINDAHGYPVGDAVLETMAARLREGVGDGDGVFRLSGDEFALLLRSVPDRVRAAPLLSRLIAELGRPMPALAAPQTISVSCGAACCPSDGRERSTLLARADLALREVRRAAHGGVAFFDADMGRREDERRRIRRALMDEEEGMALTLHYQPIVDLRSRRVAGFEALARLRDDRLGWIPPGRFIGIAEEDGLIGPLSARLLAMACRDALAWPAHLGLSFNLSALELKDPATAGRILGILDEAGFSPARLELEVTESAMSHHADGAEAVIDALRARGASVSIDDFGTGFSGMARLGRLRFDRLKVDRCFVSRLDDARQRTIVRSIIALGHDLGMAIVAEGIETPAQSRWLAAEGCDFGQGFFYGKPRPMDSPYPARNVGVLCGKPA